MLLFLIGVSDIICHVLEPKPINWSWDNVDCQRALWYVTNC
jgi:hypothetical protein